MGVLDNTVVILNAPPGAGKDTVARALCEAAGADHLEFKSHLRKCTALLFGVDLDWFLRAADDRDLKDVETPLLTLLRYNYLPLSEAMGRDYPPLVETLQLSPREALIYTSEVVIKPSFGADYFGRMAANSIDLPWGSVFSDGGFIEEVSPVLDKIGHGNLFIIKFTGQGGTSFEGDSRNWLPDIEGAHVLETTNDGTVGEITLKILDFITSTRLLQQEENQ
jgi:hypothetical protein